jgi:hypothetical protein
MNGLAIKITSTILFYTLPNQQELCTNSFAIAEYFKWYAQSCLK